MNKIETLLKELCPNGVEWESLGESCEIANSGRKPVKSSLRESGDIPYYGANNIQDYVNGFTHDGDYILIAEDGSASLENYSVQRVKGKFWANNHVHVIRGKDKVINGFLFHYFKYMNFSAYLTGGTRAKLTKGKLIEIKIPIPPLEIQEEIVKILDKFTDYVTELTTELTLRQKQYHYYRDKLLSFENEDIEWMLMPEVAKDFGRGKSKHRPRNDSKLYGGTIPFVQTGDIRNSKGHITDYSQTYSDFGLKQSKIWGKGTLCITIAANIAEMGILDFDACFPDSVVGFIANEEIVMTKFVAYYLESIKEVLASKSTGSAQENLNLASFSNLKIPVPSLERQLTIVKFLDNFDTICNDIYQGLPKEIELRQKQYEYYRDKLLTFD